MTHQIILGTDTDRGLQELLHKLYSDDANDGPPQPTPSALESSGRDWDGGELWQMLRVMRRVAAAGQKGGTRADEKGKEYRGT